MIADWPVDLFEFSDLRVSASLGVDSWADIPSVKVHEYLLKYAEKHGLVNNLMLNTKVLNISRSSDSKR